MCQRLSLTDKAHFSSSSPAKRSHISISADNDTVTNADFPVLHSQINGWGCKYIMDLIFWTAILVTYQILLTVTHR